MTNASVTFIITDKRKGGSSMNSPIYQAISAVIHFGGLGAAVALIIVSVLLLIRRFRPVWNVFCILCSGASVLLLAGSLVSQRCGITCTLPTEMDLVFYAGLAISLIAMLAVCFLFLRKMERDRHPVKERI